MDPAPGPTRNLCWDPWNFRWDLLGPLRAFGPLQTPLSGAAFVCDALHLALGQPGCRGGARERLPVYNGPLSPVPRGHLAEPHRPVA